MSLLSQFYPQGSAAAGFMEVMVIIAGGGGGTSWSSVTTTGASLVGGGGAGELFTGSISIKPGSTCPITIGAGGALGNGTTPQASPGGFSSIQTPVGTYLAQGGGAGGLISAPGQPGGSGGGGSYSTTTTLGGDIGGSYVSGKNGQSYLNPGGSTLSSFSRGGGGGGAGSAGQNSQAPNNGVQGGSGLNVRLTTINSGILCAGGPTFGSLANGTANTGNGAPAQPAGTASGNNGGSGIVVVSYPTQFAAAPSFPGAIDQSPNTPGFRTYTFTSSGSITLP